jgi:hypothetical protein
MSGQQGRGLALHCSCTVAAYLHVLQVLNVLHVYTSYRAMMALTLDVLKTCARALGTCEPSCMGRPARLFFTFEVPGPQGTTGRVAARSPPSREVGSGATGHTVHRSPLNGSGATIHMTTPEPFLSGRRSGIAGHVVARGCTPRSLS